MFAGHRFFRLCASGRECAWISLCCGTSVVRHCSVGRCFAGAVRQVTAPAHGMPRREPTGSVRLRRPCRPRRAAVVPRTGRFSGVDQGRHVNHLLVGLPHVALNMCRLPGVRSSRCELLAARSFVVDRTCRTLAPGLMVTVVASAVAGRWRDASIMMLPGDSGLPTTALFVIELRPCPGSGGVRSGELG